MDKIFLNHTNHPFEKWGALQKKAAAVYGMVIDMPFPQIPPSMGEADVRELAAHNAEEIVNMNPVAVLCQGEFCYTFALTEILKKHCICVVCACSERSSQEHLLADGSVQKSVEFRFVRFRAY